MVTLTIDNIQVTVPEQTSILDAARMAGIYIPTLCYLKDLNEIGACRVCIVEIEGIDQLVASCNNYVLDGMVVHTNSKKVREARRMNVELLLSTHNSSCTSCVRSRNCSLQNVSNDLGIYYQDFPNTHVPFTPWNKDYPLIRDNSKCIGCYRCIQVCDKVQNSHVWSMTSRTHHAVVDVVGGKDFSEADCTLCGQCVVNCPTGALRERDDTERVWDALSDPDTCCVVQIAPSIRTAWGEEFGIEPADANLSQLVAALRKLGFDYVINTDFSADLTIMEESAELLEHLPQSQNGGLPLFTSCCPGWMRYAKAHYPQLVDYISTCKSPQQMMGAVVKSYFAQQIGVEPSSVFSVSVMPCIAKKSEAKIPDMCNADELRDVDVVLTTRELVRMIRANHIAVHDLLPSEFDNPLGEGTGAGVIFGATGGVMEAALRTAYHCVNGVNAPDDIFIEVRGSHPWREASYVLGETTVRVAAVSGLAHVQQLCDAILAGEKHFDFVEVMACPGGCVNGGGQPIHEGYSLVPARSKKLYRTDASMMRRNSHDNPAIKQIYSEFLGEPLSHTSEEFLHTNHHSWTMAASL
ncbi:2Fe-2S iron-sulfur cluster binding domain-containing protein [Atopobium fossor]|uniref:2Fe-2S iron-sulfur cluster binding domain-containing protein n=1 Tax=Atopobium fossor TaxID=39487 RepID=UPI000405C797|nr:2Fe-2S iron-sulfur cluster binding domain-containing protein [Atopobium fossor]